MELDGTLVRYSNTTRLCAFVSHRSEGRGCSHSTHLRPPKSNLAVIFLPGLTDGLLALDYVLPLDKLLASMDITLIQPLLSSSYNAYGTSTLSKDVGEIDDLIDWLDSSLAFENTKFILWGHSTGAQISVRLSVTMHARTSVCEWISCFDMPCPTFR